MGLLLFASAHGIQIHQENTWPYTMNSETFWFAFFAFQGAVSSLSVAILMVYFLFRPGGWQAPAWLTRLAAPLSRNMFGIYLFHFIFIYVAIIAIFQSMDRSVLISLNIGHFLGIVVVCQSCWSR